MTNRSRLFIADQPTGHTIMEITQQQETAPQIEIIPAPAVVLTDSQTKSTPEDEVPPAPPVVLAKVEDHNA